jgi:hypothetical protein
MGRSEHRAVKQHIDARKPRRPRAQRGVSRHGTPAPAPTKPSGPQAPRSPERHRSVLAGSEPRWTAAPSTPALIRMGVLEQLSNIAGAGSGAAFHRRPSWRSAQLTLSSSQRIRPDHRQGGNPDSEWQLNPSGPLGARHYTAAFYSDPRVTYDAERPFSPDPHLRQLQPAPPPMGTGCTTITTEVTWLSARTTPALTGRCMTSRTTPPTLFSISPSSASAATRS